MTESTRGPAAPRRSPWPTLPGLAALLALFAIILAVTVLRAVQRAQAWPSYADTFERVAPAVVNVVAEGEHAALGSGFAVSPTEVVTARHLVLDASSVSVRGIGGWALAATVVAADPHTDLALLRVEHGDLAPAVLGTAATVRVGHTVIAIGNPYGYDHSLSVGTVGHLERRFVADAGGPGIGFLQLSMPLNPGHSGGPVFDAGGRVVGILSGAHAQGQAISFAVPVDALVDALDDLRRGQSAGGAFLGALTRLEVGALRVYAVVPSSPADFAGLQPGDTLVSVANRTVTTPAELGAVLRTLSRGEQVPLGLRRGSEAMVVEVTLTDWARQVVVTGGMTLRPAPGTGGEVMAVRPRSRADRAGVRVGDRLVSVDGVPVRAPAEVQERLSGGAPADLVLLRDAAQVPLRLGGSG